MIATPHTPTEIAQWLQQFGHAWGDESLRDIDAGRAAMMDGSESDYHALVRSFQELDANVAVMAGYKHRRELAADGDVGPATLEVMAFPRCAMPDHAPPPGARFAYDDPELQAAVESYQQFADEYKGGSGSWPKGCDPQVPNYHSARANVQMGGASAHQKSTWAECSKMVEDCLGEMGHSIRHILEGDLKECEHDVRFQSIAGSTIGFAYFPTPNTCAQVVNARIDNGFNPRSSILAELYVHEYQGHSIGLQHTRGGIMNPSIGSPQNPPSFKGDTSEATVRRYFGGVAIPKTPTTPTDPTDPIPGDPWAGSSITVQLPGKSPRRFIPAIEV